jgi:ubiquinone/menaquinone biosynthesis C-methylase UbiE
MKIDAVFAGPVPQLYDRYLGPILFQPFADAVAERLTEADCAILETASGTGIITCAVAAKLPQSTILATDLNPAMLEVAAEKVKAGNLTWHHADAQSLPVAAGSFDVVLCGFGVMFMPNKAGAFREARRALRPEGRFIFTVWDRIEANPLMQIADETAAALFPDDPPHFLARTPCGYHDKEAIERELWDAGFSSVRVEELQREAQVPSPLEPAIGCCQGTPLRSEIEARDPTGIERVTNAVAAALTQRFGHRSFRAPMQALLITAA